MKPSQLSTLFAHRRLFLAVCSTLLFSFSTVWAQNGEPITFQRVKVAVFPLEVNPPTQEGELDLGEFMARELFTALFSSRRFDIVDRSVVDQAMEELGLAGFGLANTDQALEFGSFTQANTFVSGTISVLRNGSIRISVVFSDVATLSALKVVSADATSEEQFPDVAQRIVEEALLAFPLTGNIVDILDDRVLIDLGIEEGLKREDVGRRGDIIRIEVVAGGNLDPRLIGTFTVLEVLPSASWVAVEMDGNELVESDRVQIQLVGGPPPLPPVTLIETGTLRIIGEPIGAEAFIDGESVGILSSSGLTFTLPVGEITLEVRADNFTSATYRATISADQETRLPITLDPLPSTLTITTSPVPATVTLDGQEIGQTPLQRDDIPVGEYRLTISAEGYEPQQAIITINPGQAYENSFILKPLDATLQLEVNVPNHTVTIDETNYPAGEAITLPPGQYRLMVSAEGYRPHNETINLGPGQQLPLAVTLDTATGILVVTTGNVSARVLINGTLIDSTPLDLPAGTYELRIVAEGFVPLEESVTIAAGETTTIERSLVPMAQLSLTVTPQEAEVSIDGIIQTDREVELTPGEHTVVVQAEGYREDSRIIELAAGARESLPVTLEPLPGALTITTIPIPAIVTLDNDVIGITPIDDLEIPAGEHLLQLEAEGYQPQQRTITINPGQTLELPIPLAPHDAALLALTVTPQDAEVSIDGIIQTNREVELTPGEHTVVVQAEGYREDSRLITLAPAQRQRLAIILEPLPGTLTITTTPVPAIVTLNGREIGITPINNLEIIVGTHQLRLRAGGYEPRDVPITINPGQFLELPPVALTPRPALLALTITPQDAEVRIDGAIQSDRELSFQPGEYQLTVSAEGYQEAAQTVTLQPGERRPLEITLLRAVGGISITSSPVAATVTLDGQEIGQTPLQRDDIPAGEYLLQFEAEGYQPQQRTVTINPGQTLPQEITLVRAVGGISITTSPVAATATLDGNVFGQTPIADLRLPVGEHRLQLEAAGYEPVERTVTIVAGQTQSIEETLTPSAALVVLSISEEQYEVFVDGESRGQETQLSLDPGRHTIEVRAPDALPTTFDLELGAGERITRVITLEFEADIGPSPDHGTLMVSSNLQNARIELTDLLNREAPPIIVEIPALTGEVEVPEGFYDVRATAPQAKPIADAIDVQEGRITERSYAFETVDLTIIGGVGNNEGKLELLLFTQYNGGSITEPITITGPEGWNQNQTVTTQPDGDAFQWLFGIPADPGTYTANITIAQLGELFTVFGIETEDRLSPAAGLEAASTSDGASVSVEWAGVEGAVTYRASLENQSSGVIIAQTTQDSSVTFSGLDLSPEESHLACIEAFNWQVGSEDLLSHQPSASRTCTTPALSVQEVRPDTSGTPTGRCVPGEICPPKPDNCQPGEICPPEARTDLSSTPTPEPALRTIPHRAPKEAP